MPHTENHRPETAERYQTLLALMRERKSCRRYDPSREVDRTLVEQCVEAARSAPSACNRQPWRFVIIDEPNLVEQCRQQARKPGIPHPWWDDVPVFIALCAEKDLVTHGIAPVLSGIPYYLIDMGIAGEHFVLAAQSLGLGTCWIGWFRQKAVRKLLHIPRSVKIVSLITLGWPMEDAPQKNDTGTGPAQLKRKPLESTIAWNGWKNE